MPSEWMTLRPSALHSFVLFVSGRTGCAPPNAPYVVYTDERGQVTCAACRIAPHRTAPLRAAPHNTAHAAYMYHARARDHADLCHFCSNRHDYKRAIHWQICVLHSSAPFRWRARTVGAVSLLYQSSWSKTSYYLLAKYVTQLRSAHRSVGHVQVPAPLTTTSPRSNQSATAYHLPKPLNLPLIMFCWQAPNRFTELLVRKHETLALNIN